MTTPLRYAPFRYLAGGRLVSMLGNAIAPIALAFAVLDLTHSAGDLGLVVGARSLTMVVFLLFGGVIADRLPRHLVMVASSGLAALSQGAIAVLVLTHSATIPLLIGLSAISGLTGAFAFPASSALLPQTVPDSIRTQANAINRLGMNAAMIVGASAGGLLVAAVSPGWGLAIDACTFIAAAVLYSLVRVADHRAEQNADNAEQRESTSTLYELRIGWREFVSRSWVWIVVLGFMFFNMAETGAESVLGPTVADATFGRPAWGFILAAQTAGMVVGAFVVMRVKTRRLLLVGVACCVAPPFLLAALALAPYTVIMVPLAFITGIAIEQFSVAWEVSVQEHVPADKLARVYSYDALGSMLVMPLGQVIAGPLAAVVGTETALLIAAGVAMLSVVGMLSSRSVRTLEHRPSLPEPSPEPEPAIMTG